MVLSHPARPNGSPADAWNIRRLRDGDQSALEDLIESHRDMVMRLSRFFMHDPDDAADVAQEAWIRVVRRIDTLQEPERFQPWLKSIVRNISLTALGRRGIHRGHESSLDTEEVTGFACDERGPDGHMEARDTQSAVWEALGALSSEDRRALFLREHRQMDYPQIAQEMGITANAAHVRLFRARERFRDAMQWAGETVPPCGVSSLKLSFLVDATTVDTPLTDHTAACADCTQRLERMSAGHSIFQRTIGLAPCHSSH